MKLPYTPFAQVIRKMLVDLDLSRSDLAAALNVSPSWISWFFQGEIKLKETHYEKVKDFFIQHGVSDFDTLRLSFHQTVENVGIADLSPENRVLVANFVNLLRNKKPTDLSLITDDQFAAYLERQWKWSLSTFGPGCRTKGVLAHIRKECEEAEADPFDLTEWGDIITLGLDGFQRHGGTIDQLLPTLQAKQDKNFAREWPNWREVPEGQAIEHVRPVSHTTSEGDRFIGLNLANLERMTAAKKGGAV